jgi:predicted Zn finger-like uncharacterized protein
MRSSAIHVECPVCRAHYHVALALFKGAKGIRFRCRRCENSLDVLHPAGTGPDRDGPNDPSFSRDPSGGSGTQPAVSLDGEEQSTSMEGDLTLPAGEPECFSPEDEEDKGSREETWGKIFSVMADAPILLPKFPPRSRRSSLVVPFLFLLLVVGGFVYLTFTEGGQGMLSGIARSLADTVTFLRS